MTTFLSKISDDILENYATNELKDLLMLVPSRRVGLHLKRELSKKIKKAFWSPQILTIDEFLVDLHDFGKIDNITIHFELYKAYTKLFGTEESFDSFRQWSSQIINDFNEIDRYMLSHETVFSNLRDIKEIEQWSFNSTELSEGQQKFLEFWEKLGELYKVFTQQLTTQKLATSAKIYRDIASNPGQYLEGLPYKKIYIFGFNALSKSEETIFKYLYQTSKSKLFWDADKYYIQEKMFEAGNFIRRYNWATESIKNISDDLLKSQKNIHLYPAKTTIDQVNISAKIIEENPEFATEKSALILSDETLLSPLINAIPNNLDAMNITMGYSLRYTTAKELLDTCLDITLNSQRFSKSKSIYYKDLNRLFDNSIIKHFAAQSKENVDRFTQNIVKYNYSFITPKNIKDYLPEYSETLSFLFYDEKVDTKTYLKQLKQFVNLVRQELIKQETLNIEIESLYKIEWILEQLEEILQKYPYVESIAGLRKLIYQVLNAEKLDFYGEPLQGLQITGFLETRALDFEHVILLSCNESFLPGVSPNNSLIPFDLRCFLQLPTKSDRESIFAYYFYRILQKAKNIHLIYNNGIANALESNEVSRYIVQIENELALRDNIKLHRHQINYDSERKSKVKSITKDSFTLVKIDDFFQSGMSPSALNNYMECPLDFYYKYILRIAEQEEVEESIESSTQGTITHKVLENLYRTHSPMITTESIDKMLKEYEQETQKEFDKHFPQKNYMTGKNLLSYSMVLKSIRKFLLQERYFIAKRGAIHILDLEKKMECELEVETIFGTKTVKLKGSADRIDKVGNTVRILDYKTGFVESKDVGAVIDKLLNAPKANQLMFYAYLYYRNYKSTEIESGIISLRNLNAGVLSLKVKAYPLDGGSRPQVIELTEDVFLEYEEMLKEVIREIYSVECKFEHNEKAKYCIVC